MNVTPNKIEIFNKWKDFYEKSFFTFGPPENRFGLYEFKFNKLKKDTQNDMNNDFYYKNSILYFKLEGIRDVIPLVNKNETSLKTVKIRPQKSLKL